VALTVPTNASDVGDQEPVFRKVNPPTRSRHEKMDRLAHLIEFVRGH